MFCKHCGTQLAEGEVRCPSCGAIKDGVKFCQHCGQPIDSACVVCTHCGKQVSPVQPPSPPQVIVNNNNINQNNVGGPIGLRPKDKWIALLLCIFLGGLGAHKFYEGRILFGILYLFTLGLFGFGVIVDIILILCKPNPYYV